jgi:DeoR/GlpR family transcriptional regulator of sugar metabolism
MGVADVAKHLKVSLNTARRDLAALAESSEATRTLGGAVAAYDRRFASFADRAERGAAAKRRVAGRAAKLVRQLPAGSRVFLDAGTTLALVAALLAKRPFAAEIVTNSLAVADRLGVAKVPVRVLGGTLMPRQAALLDEQTVRAAAELDYDLALCGAEAIDASGAWNSDNSVVELQRAVIGRCRRVALCVDASKLAARAPALLASWDEIDLLITDADPAGLREQEIRLGRGRVLRPAKEMDR